MVSVHFLVCVLKAFLALKDVVQKEHWKTMDEVAEVGETIIIGMKLTELAFVLLDAKWDTGFSLAVYTAMPVFT